VYHFLHRKGQDLLAPCLGRRACVGRFSTGKTRFFLPVNSGFHRWTPSQQATLALTLDEVAADAQRDTSAVLAVITQLAAMAEVSPTRLIALAALDNPRPAVRDAALRALGKLDAGQGVATLLQALNDARARIAIYGIRRAILDMPLAAAMQILRATPADKVTVAKEVVRLLGELACDEAYAELLAYDGRELHRDVRAALLRALWSYLDRDETWKILGKAVTSADPGQADVAVRTPADNLNPAGQLQLIRLLSAMLAHDDAIVRVATLGRLALLPLNDPEHMLLSPMVAALASRLPDESRAAANAVFATYAGREAGLIGAATAQLLSNRRALQTLIHALSAGIVHGGTHLLPTARVVLSALTPDPLTATLRADIAAVALPFDELPGFFNDLAARSEFHADVLLAADHALARRRVKSSKEQAVDSLELALSESRHPHVRRVGLAILLAMAHSSAGWTPARMARLTEYQADGAPLVAETAQFTFPPT
jgi:hypothetical protein